MKDEREKSEEYERGYVAMALAARLSLMDLLSHKANVCASILNFL